MVRFGLFLQQLRVSQHSIADLSFWLSLWFGTALIAVGVVVNLLAGWRHARMVGELDRGQQERPHYSAPAVAITLFLAMTGLTMTVYLISLHASTRSNPENNFRNDKETFMMPATNNGVAAVLSNHSVDQTVEKLKGILQEKGVALFALVDHSGEAEKVGLKMRPTKLLIFGSPKAGTPLMLAAPSVAIDLPLKILVWEDTQGKVWVAYNAPTYLQERHSFPKELLQNIAVVETLAISAGE